MSTGELIISIKTSGHHLVRVTELRYYLLINMDAARMLSSRHKVSASLITSTLVAKLRKGEVTAIFIGVYILKSGSVLNLQLTFIF